MADNNSYCAYPFFHIQVKPNGMYKPCCRFEVAEAHKMQTVRSPFEAFHGKVWDELRSKINADEHVAGCNKCFRQEENQGSSMRMNDAQAKKEYGFEAPGVKLKFVEMAFGNFCNLRCRSCNGDLSSKWHSDEEHLRNEISFRHTVTKEKVIDSNLIPSLNFEHFKDVEHIKFTGGEPMLHRDFEAFLAFLVDSDLAKNIFLRVCTNASYAPKEKMVELLKKFKFVEISLSIDGYGKQNEYLRNPSLWETVNSVSREWVKKAASQKNWEVNLCATVSSLSLIALPPLLAWWKELEGVPEVIFQPVFDPLYLSPEILPAEFVSQFSSALPPHVAKLFSGKKASAKNLSQFFEFNHALDKVRKESLFEVFPEFQKLKWV